MDDAGDVDEHCDGPAPIPHLAQAAGDFGGDRHVEPESARADEIRIEPARLGLGLRVIQVAQRDAVAVGQEALGASQADPARRARNQGQSFVGVAHA